MSLCVLSWKLNEAERLHACARKILEDEGVFLYAIDEHSAQLSISQLAELAEEARKNHEFGDKPEHPQSCRAQAADKPAEIDVALLFCSVDMQKIHELLHKLKEAGIQVKLKASLTDHNKEWKFIDFIEHLQEEHEGLISALRLHKLVAAVRGYLQSKGTRENAELIAALESAQKVQVQLKEDFDKVLSDAAYTQLLESYRRTQD